MYPSFRVPTAIIFLWVDTIAGHLKCHDGGGRKTQKSNFSELCECPLQASVRIEAVQMQATLFLSLGIKCYSQWFEGERNHLSDILSHDDDRSDNELTNNAIKSFCPSQVHCHFKIIT